MQSCCCRLPLPASLPMPHPTNASECALTPRQAVVLLLGRLGEARQGGALAQQPRQRALMLLRGGVGAWGCGWVREAAAGSSCLLGISSCTASPAEQNVLPASPAAQEPTQLPSHPTSEPASRRQAAHPRDLDGPLLRLDAVQVLLAVGGPGVGLGGGSGGGMTRICKNRHGCDVLAAAVKSSAVRPPAFCGPPSLPQPLPLPLPPRPP